MGHSLQIWSYVIISTAFALGTSSILLRLYCRWRLKALGNDDVAAGFLFFVNVMQQAILYIFLGAGCALPASEAPADIGEKINTWLFVEEIFYMFTHFTLKETFLLFYLRLSPDERFRRVVYSTMALCVLLLVIEWLLAFLQVRPLQAYFHPNQYPDAQYLNQYIVQMVPTALNAFSDIIILILPIPMILPLQMSTRRKMLVLGIMAFGSLSVVTALCRFIVQKQLISDAQNTPYVMGRMIIVAGIEIQVAVIAVNLPALRSLFTSFVGSSNQSAQNTSGHRLASMDRYKQPSLKKARTPLVDMAQTLTESEEELMRQHGVAGNENIMVVTDVEVMSQKVASRSEESFDNRR